MTRRRRVAVRYHANEPDGRHSIPKTRRAVIHLDDIAAFVGGDVERAIFIMAEPLAGLLDKWRKSRFGR